jgi:hypothetical protein
MTTISNPFAKNIYPTPTTIPFALIFDNSGRITLQTDNGYTHVYDCGQSAAKDVCLIMQGIDPIKMWWDGDEPENTYDDLNDLPAECVVYDADDVLRIVQTFDAETGMQNVRDFFTALEGLIK